jgi:hypothetical protein
MNYEVLMIEATFNARLERIACQLERRQGCKVYREAWRVAARVVREQKRVTNPKGVAVVALRASTA